MRERVNGCTGKVRYYSRGEAKFALERMKAKEPDKAGELHLYKCKNCGATHVGTRKRRG